MVIAPVVSQSHPLRAGLSRCVMQTEENYRHQDGRQHKHLELSGTPKSPHLDLLRSKLFRGQNLGLRLGDMAFSFLVA